MYRQAWSVSLLLAWLSMTGCASIMHGITQDVGIASVPTGAAVSIDNISHGRTPVIATLSRKANHLVRMELAGYHPFEATLTQAVSGWVWGNIVFGGVIGVGVDALSGGFYRLAPEQVTATLLPLAEPSLAQAHEQGGLGLPTEGAVEVPTAIIRRKQAQEESSNTVQAFRLDRRPVSNRAFLAFVHAYVQWAKGHIPEALHDGSYLRAWAGEEGIAPTDLDQPVHFVSFFAARAFCQSHGKTIPTLLQYRVATHTFVSEAVTVKYPDIYFCTFFLSHPKQYQQETLA